MHRSMSWTTYQIHFQSRVPKDKGTTSDATWLQPSSNAGMLLYAGFALSIILHLFGVLQLERLQRSTLG